MDNINILNPIIGGALIGIAASLLLWLNGRVMGVSGILGGVLKPKSKDTLWRVLFLVGIFIGSLIIPKLGFSIMTIPFERGLSAALFGGLLVGLGTTIGNGCTSGHGVCGISRLSPRSLAATVVFMILGILSVSLFNYFSKGQI